MPGEHPIVNPLVQRLLDAGGDVLTIGGYVGSTVEDRVRLYRDLSLRSYVEISTDAVVRIVQDPQRPEEPCVVFFKSTAELTYVQTLSARADQALAAVATARSGRGGCAGCGAGGSSALARERDEGGPTLDLCQYACQEKYALCADAAGGSSWRAFWCVLDYYFCSLGCIIGDAGPILV